MAMDDVTSADTQTQVDSARLETLLDKMARDVSGMMSTVMAHVGDRLGLFTTLAVGPATSAELAARADVSERYVREWLGGMAAAGYITYDAVSDTYSLSPEQTRVLAEEGGPFFMGGVYQTTPALMGPLELLLDAFRKGGGVPQSAYSSDLWEGMERSSAVWSNHLLARTIQAEMPHVQTMLDAGARVADIGCGHGSALIALARAFPAAHYVGYDQFAPEVARATENAKVAGVSDRVRFAQADVAHGLPEQYDIITSFDVVHDSAHPLELLKAIHAALRPDGIYVCFEPGTREKLEDRVGHRATFLYGSSLFYCMTTSLSQGGEGLGAQGLPESKVRALCAEAGFSAVRRVTLKDAFGQDDTFHSMFDIRR